MKDSHTYCVCCGRRISTELAKRFAGSCSICYEEKASTIEPEDFTLPQELEDRIRALDDSVESLMSYREIAWVSGVESVSRVVESHELERTWYHRWSPRLLEFSRTCRERDPGPSANELSPKDKAIQQVYRNKLVPDCPEPHSQRINVCLMPRLAIPVARTVWPKLPQNTVILTPEEFARWKQSYQPSDTETPNLMAMWGWLAIHRWEIKDVPSPFELQFSGVEVQAGRDPWLVEHEVPCAPAFQRVELWTWDGTSVEFDRVLHQMFFS